MEAVWRDYAPRTVLAPPRDAAENLRTASGAKPNSGTTSKRFAIVEYLRTNAKGKVIDKRHALVSRRSSQPPQRRSAPARNQDHYASGHRYADERSWGWFQDYGGWRGPGAFGRPPARGYAPGYERGARSRW